MIKSWQKLLARVKRAASDRSADNQDLYIKLADQAELLLMQSSLQDSFKSDPTAIVPILDQLLNELIRVCPKGKKPGLFLRAARWAESSGITTFAERMFQMMGTSAAEIDNFELHTQALEELGEVYRRQGEFEKARICQEDARVTAHQQNLTALEAHAVNNLGVIDVETGNFDNAGEKFETALELAEISGETLLLGHLYNNIGVIYCLKGLPEKAYSELNRAMALRANAHDDKGYIETCHNLGKCLMDLEKYKESSEFLTEALNKARNLRIAFIEADILLSRADLMLRISQFEIALQCAREALASHKKMDNPLGVADAMRLSGTILLKLGKKSEAIQMLLTAYGIVEKIGHPNGCAEVSEVLMAIYLEAGNSSEAEKYFRIAHQVYLNLQNPAAAAGIVQKYENHPLSG
jgi:tetratricopeptide (TPR) repeat protein